MSAALVGSRPATREMDGRQLPGPGPGYSYLLDPPYQTHVSEACAVNDSSQQKRASEASIHNPPHHPPLANERRLKQHHHRLPQKQHGVWMQNQYEQQRKWRDNESLKQDASRQPTRASSEASFRGDVLALPPLVAPASNATEADHTKIDTAALFDGALSFDQHSAVKFGLTSGMSVMVMVEVCGILQPNKYQRVLTWEASEAGGRLSMEHVSVHVPEGPVSPLYMHGWTQHAACTLGKRKYKSFTCVIDRSSKLDPATLSHHAQVCGLKQCILRAGSKR